MRVQTWLEPGWRGDLLALVAGGLLPLAFAPFSLFPLAVLSPAVLFALWSEGGPGAGFRRGFLFGLGLFGVGVSWVYVAIHVYGYTGVVPSALLTALFVAVLALYPGLCGYAAVWLRRRCRISQTFWLVGAVPALWVGIEWLRGWFLSGFPWLELGYSQIDSPLAGLGPLTGVYGLSWAVVLSAGALVAAGGARTRRLWVGVVAGLAALWVGSGLLGTIDWTKPSGKPIRVALVQGDLPQITKWDPEQIKRRLELYADLTLPRLGKADLIVWPENSLTLFYHDLKNDYLAWLQEKAKASGTDVVLGLPVMDEKSGRYYSSMMSLGRHEGFYHKRHLVPFGEYVPFGRLLRGLIGFFDLPMSGFSPGPAHQPLLQVDGQRAGVSICYEDAFGAEVAEALPRATLLINGSNNAWYGDSLAPHQHLQISRMRALETGRPLLRATTNGITALVGPHGHLRAEAPQFRTYVLEGTVQPMAGMTPFAYYRNVPVLAALALVLGLSCLVRERR